MQVCRSHDGREPGGRPTHPDKGNTDQEEKGRGDGDGKHLGNRFISDKFQPKQQLVLGPGWVRGVKTRSNVKIKCSVKTLNFSCSHPSGYSLKQEVQRCGLLCTPRICSQGAVGTGDVSAV